MKKIIVCFCIIVSGCASTPYAEVSVGWNLGQKHSESYDYCRLPFMAELGLQHGKIEYGLRHDSNVDCGTPFNRKPEFYRDQAFVKYRTNL